MRGWGGRGEGVRATPASFKTQTTPADGSTIFILHHDDSIVGANKNDRNHHLNPNPKS